MNKETELTKSYDLQRHLTVIPSLAVMDHVSECNDSDLNRAGSGFRRKGEDRFLICEPVADQIVPGLVRVSAWCWFGSGLSQIGA